MRGSSNSQLQKIIKFLICYVTSVLNLFLQFESIDVNYGDYVCKTVLFLNPLSAWVNVFLFLFWQHREIAKAKYRAFSFERKPKIFCCLRTNWLSNLSKLILSNGTKNVRTLFRMPLKRLFFLLKNHKNRPAPGGSASRPPSVICVSCTGLLSTLPNWDVFQEKKVYLCVQVHS